MVSALRRAGLREDGPPRADEVLVPLLVWSLVFEVVLPRAEAFRGVAIADPRDVLAYTAGALVATVYWRWRYGVIPA